MLISASNLTKYYGEKRIFENVTFELGDHDKAGFVGSNGVGKTTLFRVLTGEEPSDGGEVFVGKNVKVGYMHQHTDYTLFGTVWEEMLKIFEPLTETEKEIEDIVLSLETGDGDRDSLIRRHAFLTEQFEKNGGYFYKNKMRSVLMGLGFNEEDFNTSVSVLSGGQRTRLLLARLLLEQPELLLLDEPTNHLDIASLAWLEEYLVSYPGGIIVISHDRYFLDKVTNRTIEMENGRLNCFKGNYSKYAKLKEEQNLHLTRVYENTTAEIERLKGIIEQQRRWNREKNIKTAESKQKIVDRLMRELEVPPSEQETINFKFTAKRSSGNDVLRAEGVSKSFDGKKIFEGADIEIHRGERIFLLGANGCGKTTFFKILLGKLQKDSGNIRFGTNVDIGYYDQIGETLNPDNTIIEEIWEAFPNLNHTRVRCACAAFLFKGEEVFKRIGDLSGGEKARVSLIKLMLSGSNFLMLDEPTNHLDIASREVLEQAFADYEGTMLIVSHDRYFTNKLADSICVMTENGIIRYEGNYDYYLEKSAAEKSETTTQTTVEEKPVLNDYKERKELAKRVRKLENTVKKCESEIERLDDEIEKLKKSLEQPEIAVDYEKMMEITTQIDALSAQFDENFILLEQSETELKELK